MLIFVKYYAKKIHIISGLMTRKIDLNNKTCAIKVILLRKFQAIVPLKYGETAKTRVCY